MQYHTIVPAGFIDRPNRFMARVELEGRVEEVHVKNTGRCRELLQPGVTVYLEQSEKKNRLTAYDLIAVEKGARTINIDSQAPNKAVEEWLHGGEMFPGLLLVRPETCYGNSRFDFYIENKNDAGEIEKIFLEVKGVTLEEDGIVRFPDAPSDRAVKHVEELIAAKKEGYRAVILFVIQMENVICFIPNKKMHDEFATALNKAREQGVEILAYDCRVTPDGMTVSHSVPVFLTDEEYKESLINLKIKEIAKPLLAWYDSNRRVLPWREDPTPYRVWVSEIMLQQTRVEAVKPYFERFMKKLPTIEALACAPEEDLLKLWEGLGYYNRVRNLQKAAIQIVEQYDGNMPQEYEELQKLKGIGSYTAGAISSIAYGKANPAVDGNVLRVLSRIREDDRLISDTRVKTAVEEELREVIPKDRPGEFNQALMEIGACVCVPNGAPHCEECPLEDICMAHADGVETEYPRKKSGKARTIEDKTILIIRDENKTVLRKRENKGLLAGMYEFPTMDGHHTAEEVTRYLSENGLKTIRIRTLEDAKHIFSHKEWHMKGYMIRVDELEPRSSEGIFADWIYIEPEDTREKYPIPAAFAAYTKYLNIRLGNNRYKESDQ